MTAQFLLEGEHFRLSMDFDVLESDIIYPNNTTLTVSVFSDDFSATTRFDIDAKRIPDSAFVYACGVNKNLLLYSLKMSMLLTHGVILI